MLLFSNRRRPIDQGHLPMERLPRRDHVPTLPDGRMPKPPEATGLLGEVADSYLALFAAWRDGEVAGERAAGTEDPKARTRELKAGCYFMDADLVGVAGLDAGTGGPEGHGFALVILVQEGRLPETGNLARAWAEGGRAAAATLRAAEIANVAAGFIRRLGWSARAHFGEASEVDAPRLALLAGLVVVGEDGLVNGFLDENFALAVVTTDYRLTPDRPLAADAFEGARSIGYWLGRGGAESGLERWRKRRRLTHMSAFPMERITRRATPTTLIHEDEIPRVSKRAAFFERALRGDLGPKARTERTRFATKHPFAAAMVPMIRGLVPHQDGEIAAERADLGDAAANSRAIKSLSYLLGADLTGICETRDFAWFSHGADGRPIVPYHRYAVVMLIDQGHGTMEGSSGDDWISGAQSMRAYLRGAEMAGVMADMLRRLGHGARAQTNLDSDVLHIPLLLLAGLGEMSRIGELVLNPFVGPRFKSVVMTTDLPLEVDRPIDFGLQDMCQKCRKCARECPCDAIPHGDKVMFNGYETWKPDVQRCASYRVTNMRGSACGRCMKTCPYNNEGLLAHRLFLWLAIHVPWSRRWIADLDDKVGNGNINRVKRWWQDLEIVGDRTIRPKLANARDLDLGKDIETRRKTIAYFPASTMPPPDAGDAVPVDRKLGLAMAEKLETPGEAEARRRDGGPPPDIYRPTPPIKDPARPRVTDKAMVERIGGGADPKGGAGTHP